MNVLLYCFLSTATLGQATLVKKLLVAGLGADPEASGTGGGTDCAGCTILISLFEQFLEANKLEVKEVNWTIDTHR